MGFIQRHKEGAIATVLFHTGVLLLLFWLKFHVQDPLPEEKGILVDFGTTETGFGQTDPAPQSAAQATPPQEIDNKVTQETTQPPMPQTSAATQASAQAKNPVMTQDYEEAAALEQEAKRKATEEQNKRDAEQKKILKQQQEEQERENQARIAREKQVRDSLKKIEDARIAEERRIADLRRRDSIKKAEEAAKLAALNSRAKNAFGGASGQTSGSSSTSQGVTYGTGNQGSTAGTVGAGQYGAGGGEGISFNLTGRSMKSMVKPVYSENEDGIVVVTITVDINGNVVNATAGARGTTTPNISLRKAAEKAALSTKFNVNKDAPAQQIGTITYKFVLN